MTDAPRSQIPAPWYQEAFGADYLARYAHRDEAEARQAVALFLNVTGLGPGALVFDLCCGAGRHLAHLRARGMNGWGGDLSGALLGVARGRGLPVVQLDMARLPLRPASQQAITNFFTAFGYFGKDEENFAVFEEVSGALRPGGWFFMDFLNAEQALAAVRAAEPEEIQPAPEHGGEWRIRRRIQTPGPRAEKVTELWVGGRPVRSVCESVRLFQTEELREAMHRAGLAVSGVWGDYLGGPYVKEQSPRCILAAQRFRGP